MDLNLYFQVSIPPALTDESNADAKILYERWKRSNILFLSFILQHVPKNIRAGVLIQKFTFMCYIVKENIREYIIAIRDIIFSVHYILQILPIKYDLFKISYYTHKDEWSMIDLMI
ncbi:unnamed protein product [Spirodela intermedia]|uniref:Uncharacterized protein n=1 Tax=Spirodela intermedia TaxID=51605 RepID=A0A7I8K3F1_SPIIN|nr:unnamed protein product [Spirodela intermedia]